VKKEIKTKHMVFGQVSNTEANGGRRVARSRPGRGLSVDCDGEKSAGFFRSKSLLQISSLETIPEVDSSLPLPPCPRPSGQLLRRSVQALGTELTKRNVAEARGDPALSTTRVRIVEEVPFPRKLAAGLHIRDPTALVKQGSSGGMEASEAVCVCSDQTAAPTEVQKSTDSLPVHAVDSDCSTEVGSSDGEAGHSMPGCLSATGLEQDPSDTLSVEARQSNQCLRISWRECAPFA